MAAFLFPCRKLSHFCADRNDRLTEVRGRALG